MKNTKSLVKNIIWKSPNIIKLTCQPKTEYKFKAGQYTFVKAKGMLEPRPLSIASPIDAKTIEFHIRKIANSHSNTFEVLSNLKMGDEIELSTADGNNCLDLTQNKPLTLIAGGVGIAPMYSIITTVLQKQKNREISLYWGVNSAEDLYLQPELTDLQKQYTNFKLNIACQNKLANTQQGIVTDIIQTDINNIVNGLIHIAGPAKMMQATIKIMQKNNVDESNMFYDKFW